MARCLCNIFFIHDRSVGFDGGTFRQKHIYENSYFMSATTFWPAKPGDPETGLQTAADRPHSH